MAHAQRLEARVYDPVLRVLHWVNALLVTLLLASGLVSLYSETGALTGMLHQWHGWLGAALWVGICARLAWGLVGPEHARWKSLWHPRAWAAAFASGRFFTPARQFGHHPVASLAYLLLYGLLGILAVTGLVLLAIEQGVGPLSAWLGWHISIEALPTLLHELTAWSVLGFVCLHVAALILHPVLHQQPVAQAMITGVQYLPQNSYD